MSPKLVFVVLTTAALGLGAQAALAGGSRPAPSTGAFIDYEGRFKGTQLQSTKEIKFRIGGGGDRILSVKGSLPSYCTLAGRRSAASIEFTTVAKTFRIAEDGTFSVRQTYEGVKFHVKGEFTGRRVAGTVTATSKPPSNPNCRSSRKFSGKRTSG